MRQTTLLRSIIFIICTAIGGMLCTAEAQSTNNANQKIVMPESNELDSLLSKWVMRNFEIKSVIKLPAPPMPSDAILEERLRKITTIIDLPFNEITRKHIETYAMRNRTLTQRMLTLSRYYYPIFDRYFIQSGLPYELQHLAIIESALNPAAISRFGAAGIWQIMPATARNYGLNINTFVDERCSPTKSTEAAVRLFADLYSIYKDWSLVIAAYNCGTGNVNKAIKRAGGKRDYWEIYPYLPTETRNFVPAFIAINYIMNYAAEHNIFPVKANFPFDSDTIMVRNKYDFEEISRRFDVSIDELKMLNPQYRRGVVPGHMKPYPLMLPRRTINAFIDFKDSINKSTPLVHVDVEKTSKQSDKDTSKKQAPKTHIVVKGDSPYTIARKYKTTTAKILKINGLKESSKLRVGQKIMIP